jgi:hypothetical protein
MSSSSYPTNAVTPPLRPRVFPGASFKSVRSSRRIHVVTAFTGTQIGIIPHDSMDATQLKTARTRASVRFPTQQHPDDASV